MTEYLNFGESQWEAGQRKLDAAHAVKLQEATDQTVARCAGVIKQTVASLGVPRAMARKILAELNRELEIWIARDPGGAR